MHHKRKRPKNRRSGCLMCKPWKANGTSADKRARPGERRALEGERSDARRVRSEPDDAA